MRRIVNLTPHAITVLDEDDMTVLCTLPPSGVVARVATERIQIGSLHIHGPCCPVSSPHHGDDSDCDLDPEMGCADIPIYRTVYGEVTGLPDPEPWTYYLVSLVVRQACPDRADLLSPGELVRGSDGQPVGCRGLTR